jgi:radical SAM protein with 4Fe4S-binding SPASM domain
MNAKDFVTELFPKIVKYRLSRLFGLPPALPITLTYAVTYRCNSRCMTCKIWELYRKEPERRQKELDIQEIEKVFASIGHTYFFNVSGGEPFLRRDMTEIIRLAIKYLSPKIIHIPTNGLMPEIIEREVERMVTHMDEIGYRVPITVKPSLDGVGEEHDRIRGVPGNFKKLMDTVERLKALQKRFPFLIVELGTVISRENMDKIDEISQFAHSLGVESYRNEMAEQRSEFFNFGDPITPSAEEYIQTIEVFSRDIRKNLAGKRRLTKITESLRLVYYDIAIRILKENRQVIPCYGGITNVQINPYGDVWPCCVLGFEQNMGNVREHDYDFKKVFHSEQAKEVRRYIKEGNCSCPLANQAYSNILCHIPSMLKFGKNILFSSKK